MKNPLLILTLLCITATISLFADSKISPPKKLRTQHHYYGVEANTGALIWLESSTNLYWTPSAFMSNTFTVIYRLQSKLETVQRVWKAPIQVAQPSPPMPLLIPPMPSMISISRAAVSGGTGGGAAQSWTTNSNLRLSIKLTSKTNIFRLVSPTNNSTITNATFDLAIGPVTMVEASFPTELGKTYKCQATDDAKQTWLDGPIVAGTGHSVTNYEIPVKISRMYRVVENPL